jgi:hypothetical protein
MTEKRTQTAAITDGEPVKRREREREREDNLLIILEFPKVYTAQLYFTVTGFTCARKLFVLASGYNLPPTSEELIMQVFCSSGIQPSLFAYRQM